MTTDVEEVFASSVDGTVGLEEEFALLDPASLDMVSRFEEFRDACEDPLAGSIAGELILSEIEIRSGKGESFAAAMSAQREHRRALFAQAAKMGIALGSTGTHPWMDYRTVQFVDSEHYRRVSDGLQAVAKRNVTFSLHVHVGIQGIERAVAVTDRLRSVLPQLLALSANSPFLDGIDTGLHTARTQAFTKSFPRCGVPDAFGSWPAYREYIDFLETTKSIVEYTQVWWSVRPHFSFGTVEVRICDAQTTAQESDALAALITACVLQAARDHDEGVPAKLHPNRMIEENIWRAIRFGLDGRQLDLDTGEDYAAAGIGERLLEWTAPIRSELGLDIELAEANGAQRQRALLRAGESMRDVYASTVQLTRESFAQEGSPA